MKEGENTIQNEGSEGNLKQEEFRDYLASRIKAMAPEVLGLIASHNPDRNLADNEELILENIRRLTADVFIPQEYSEYFTEHRDEVDDFIRLWVKKHLVYSPTDLLPDEVFGDQRPKFDLELYGVLSKEVMEFYSNLRTKNPQAEGESALAQMFIGSSPYTDLKSLDLELDGNSQTMRNLIDRLYQKVYGEKK